jgi:2-amino-4-hydroxy-6-hydroxymethyldihydropteridine diphosphokinase
VSAAGRKRAFVSLGSNLGDRRAYLDAAYRGLNALAGTSVVAASHVYETAPQHLEDQPAYLNQVLCLETSLAPGELLAGCLAIEDAAGRERKVRFGPRTIDVDILLFEDVSSDDPELTLPHPRIWQRAFVLAPLAEIWSHGRGMPTVDVAALAATLAKTQPIAVVGAADE